MILNDDETLKRINSPMNLINRLRSTSNDSRKNAMQLFTGRSASREKAPEVIKELEIIETKKLDFNPFIKPSPPAAPAEIPPPTIDTILTNTDSQIKLGLAHDNALALLNRSLETLSTKLDDIKADKLPQVILAASKTVDGIRRERNEAQKNNKDREVHYHFYTPQQRKVEEFEVIDIGVKEEQITSSSEAR